MHDCDDCVYNPKLLTVAQQLEDLLAKYPNTVKNWIKDQIKALGELK